MKFQPSLILPTFAPFQRTGKQHRGSHCIVGYLFWDGTTGRPNVSSYCYLHLVRTK